MTEKEFVLDTMRATGLAHAQRIQGDAPGMTGTELYAEEQYIPDFRAAVAAKNMLQRAAGFVCRSTAGRVVRLLQPYDSTTYTQEPEELPAQWGFAWSTDPAKAKPFISLATSPYNTNDCATYPVNEQGQPDASGTEIHVFRSGQDTNTWAPGTVNIKWDDLGKLEDILAGTTTAPEEPEEPTPEPEPEEPAEAGTLENPITAERGMTYTEGLYYYDTQDGKTYLCTRGETLHYLPHELVDIYFEVIA